MRRQTWVHLTTTSLNDTGDDEDQQQQHNDAHQYDKPPDRRVTLSPLFCHQQTFDKNIL